MRTQRKEEQNNRVLAIGLDARMIAHSGIGMRIRGLLKYLGPIAAKKNFQIYLFGDVTTILNEGISCHEFPVLKKTEMKSQKTLLKKKRSFLIL